MDTKKKQIVYIIVLAFMLSTLVGLAIDKAHGQCVTDRPEYPGCTNLQVKRLEGGTQSRFKAHYHLKQWGQHSREFANLPPKVNAKFKRLYDQAVVRWRRQHSKLSQPQFDFGGGQLVRATWGEFKAHAWCFGPLGAYTGLRMGYCASGGQLTGSDMWRKIAQETDYLAIKCGGMVLTGMATGAYVAKNDDPTALSIAPGATIGATTGLIACGIDTAASAMSKPFN